MTAKVLIIGDKAKEGKALHEALRKETAYLSRIFPRVQASLEAILKLRPDVIVLNPDDSFAGMADVYRLLKQEDATSEIPLAAIVAEDELKRMELPNGIQDIFCRPLREAECVARIGMLYKRFNRISDKNVILHGDLEIDVGKYEVRIAGRKVDLTYTEYELLKFLAAHPDNVFSRDVLLNKVWGYEYYGGARTVDVHIRRLRSKIELRSARFIDTVRNIGYKFLSQEDKD